MGGGRENLCACSCSFVCEEEREIEEGRVERNREELESGGGGRGGRKLG